MGCWLSVSLYGCCLSFRQISNISPIPMGLSVSVGVCMCLCVCVCVCMYVCLSLSVTIVFIGHILAKIKDAKKLPLLILTFAIEWYHSGNCTP